MAGTLAPKKTKLTANLPASATAVAGSVVLGRAPFGGRVTAVAFIANALLTGANTNSRTISIQNKGSNGAGTKVPASKAFTSGVNAAANVATELTNSVTAADLVVAAGDVLVASSAVVGTGLADPGGLIEVTIERVNS
jgi:hypothetical protein